METNHLTDEQIQNLVDASESILSPGQREHLHRCARCRHEAALYRALAGRLEETPELIIPDAWKEAVIEKAGMGRPETRRNPDGILMGLGLATALVALALWGNLSGTFRTLWNLIPVGELSTQFETFFSSLSLPADGRVWFLVPFAVLSLGLTALIDHVIRKNKPPVLRH